MTTAVELGKNEGTRRHRLGRDTIFESVHCPRCTGFMVVEQGFDSMLGSSEADVSFRRCVQCGEVVDLIILQNRRSQRASELERTQK
jgi:hypothetical protein